MITRASSLRAGVTIAEVMVSAAILSLTMAALMVGVSTFRHTFRASEHYATTQIEQARIIDYIGRDVRRSIKVPVVDNYRGHARLTMSIPNYYEGEPKSSYTISDTPRTPTINGNTVKYGPSDVTITYYHDGTTIYRSVNGQATALVTNVADFAMSFPGASTQAVQVSVKFRPKYSYNNGDAATDSTEVKATILLRNLKG